MFAIPRVQSIIHQMFPHDDGNEHETLDEESDHSHSGDAPSCADLSDTQPQEFCPQLRTNSEPRDTVSQPSIHTATLSDAAYQDNYTIVKYNLNIDKNLYFWPAKRTLINQSLLVLPREMIRQKMDRIASGKFTAEPTPFALNKELFNYFKGKMDEDDAIEVMYQLERLMERIVKTRAALRQRVLLINLPTVLRAAGWRSVLRFAEHQFVGNQELIARFRNRLQVLFPTSVQYLSVEERRLPDNASAKTPTMNDGEAVEMSETSSALSLEDKTGQPV